MVLIQLTVMYEKLEIKQRLLSGVCLHRHDPQEPLCIEHDACDDGWGAVLYHLDGAGERMVISMANGVWEDSQMNKQPPYYREGQGWIKAVLAFRPYIEHNVHEVTCYTDHSPLSWIKSTSGKGAVGEFLLESMHWLDFHIKYRAGPDMSFADGLSRYPMLGPKRLKSEGLRTALEQLFKATPAAPKEMRVHRSY